MRALLSVSDKRGIVDFARQLVELRWEIVSTGGTAEALRREGIPVVHVEEVTGFPEMMDGRVKTLHPKVHGALLARRNNSSDLEAMQQHGITPIDLVAVNLYPFRETVAKPQTTFAQAIEQIDIGGPSMLRSAAKNHADVIVVVDPDDYPMVLDALKGGLTPGASPGLRQALATKVFAYTTAYDAAILGYLSRSQESLPPTLSLVLQRQQALRYGENPHQRAALYVTDEPGVRNLQQLHGKELSFNNLLDVDAAVMAVAPWQSRGGGGGGRARGVRHHQAHDAVRHRAGSQRRRRLQPCARDRSHVRVRVGDRVQHRRRPRGCGGDARAVRRGRRRTARRCGCTGGVPGE